MSGHVRKLGSSTNIFYLADVDIIISLNSAYVWNKDSVAITSNRFSDPLIFNRNDNTWTFSSASQNQYLLGNNLSGLSFIFPLEDLLASSSYSILYNLNGGSYGFNHPSSYSPSSSSIQEIVIANPSRGGYYFPGWSLSWNGSGSSPSINIRNSGTWLLTIPVNTTGDITLTANWSPNNNTITYNLNGGNASSSYPSSYKTSTNSRTLTISNPSLSGFDFNGWTIMRTGTFGGADPIINGTILTIPAKSYGDITLTANWVQNSFTVTFDSNGGSACSSISVTSGGTYGNLPTPTRQYYTFTGWHLNSPTGILVTSGTTVTATGNHTLFASWELMQFNLTFRSNNTGYGYVSPAMESSPQYALNSYSSTATPTHPLAEFLWWTNESGEIISYDRTITISSLISDTTCIAVFQISGASVSAQDGGEVRYNNTTINGADYIHLSAVPYSGYVFAGWSAISGAGESIDLSSYGATADIPLSLVDGAVIVAMFEPINSTDHEGTTDNGYVDMD